MMMAAPRRFAAEGMSASSSRSLLGRPRASTSPVQARSARARAVAAGGSTDRAACRGTPGETVRLEAPACLGEHDVKRLVLEQRHRVHEGVEIRATASAWASVLPTSAKLVGSAMLCASAIRCGRLATRPRVCPTEGASGSAEACGAPHVRYADVGITPIIPTSGLCRPAAGRPSRV
jgi:hypothetical protein